MDSFEKRKKKRGRVDEHYFESYSYLGIHEEMIRDKARTGTYQRAILQNPHLFRDKVVLDVGCGTAILSCFCVQGGAQKVYAVDASQIIEEAQRVVEKNNFQDKITIIKGKIEEVELPEKVDVIISEWMGYGLLYESMIESVLFARDKFLNKGGIMFPSLAEMYVVPFTDPDMWEERVLFWDSLQSSYGLDFSPLRPAAIRSAFVEPVVELLPDPSCLMDFPRLLKSVDLMTVVPSDLKTFEAEFQSSSILTGELHGICLWFDVLFEKECCRETPTTTPPEEPPTKRQKKDEEKSDRISMTSLQKEDKRLGRIRLSTSPDSEPTHWKQVLLYFDEPIKLQQDNLISGKFIHTINSENHRFVDYEVEVTANGISLSKKFQMK